jgi:hypothetical protein
MIISHEQSEVLKKLREQVDTNAEGVMLDALISRAGLKPKLKIIIEQNDFGKFATTLGVRHDWHEPDEQEVTARVVGDSFDNAGFWPAENSYADDRTELHVIISQHGVDVAAVNLATVLAWASAGYR